eukprot:5576412-Amphidinium_carterae.1
MSPSPHGLPFPGAAQRLQGAAEPYVQPLPLAFEPPPESLHSGSRLEMELDAAVAPARAVVLPRLSDAEADVSAAEAPSVHPLPLANEPTAVEPFLWSCAVSHQAAMIATALQQDGIHRHRGRRREKRRLPAEHVECLVDEPSSKPSSSSWPVALRARRMTTTVDVLVDIDMEDTANDVPCALPLELKCGPTDMPCALPLESFPGAALNTRRNSHASKPSCSIDKPTSSCAEVDRGADALATAMQQFHRAIGLKGQYSIKVNAVEKVWEAVQTQAAGVAGDEAVHALQELWREARRAMRNIGCRLHLKKNIAERTATLRQFSLLAKQIRRHALHRFKVDFQGSSGTHASHLINVNPPNSLEELRTRCHVYSETGSARHLCEHLCYYREYEPARQLHALKQRAASHPLRPSLKGWTASVVLRSKPPFWGVVIYDSHGVTRGGMEEAWAALVAGALEETPLMEQGQDDEAALPASQVAASLGLIEDLLAGQPWQLLVACILLNKTSRLMVDRMLAAFFRSWPSPEALLAAEPCELE